MLTIGTVRALLKLAPEMLQLRYANYPKDYFMGMLPASQYGSVAALPSTYRPDLTPSHVLAVGSSGISPRLINPASVS